MKLLISSILAVAFCSSVFGEDPAKLVILYGDRSHGSGAHEFKAGAKLLELCLEEQQAVKIDVTTHQNWPSENLALLDSADAIIFYNDSTKIVRNGWEKIDDLAKQGTGLMFMHYAVHPSIEEGEKYFKPWMGGYYHNDKSVNPFWKANIKALIGHPTAKGVGEIETIDEFYHSLEFSGDRSLKHLGVATPTKSNLVTINNFWNENGYNTVINGKEVPLLWGITREGGGRGAGFTGGHFHHNWAYDELRQLIMNTMVWVAGREVPEGGIPVRPLTEEELNANLDDYADKGGTVRIALPTSENRPQFAQNAFLSPEERAKVRKERKEWDARRKELIDQLIVPATK